MRRESSCGGKVVRQPGVLQTEGVDAVDLQSWAAFAAILGALIANFALMSSRLAKFEERFEGKVESLDAKFDAKFDALDTKIDRVRDELRSELHDGFGRVDARLNVIEQRTYDLSVRLPAAPASAE